MTCDHVKSWSILHIELYSDEHVLGKPLPHKSNQCHWQNISPYCQDFTVEMSVTTIISFLEKLKH